MIACSLSDRVIRRRDLVLRRWSTEIPPRRSFPVSRGATPCKENGLGPAYITFEFVCPHRSEFYGTSRLHTRTLVITSTRKA